MSDIIYSPNNATYRPDESSVDILSEHTWLQGAFLAAVAYGMEAILYFMSVHLLWTHRKPSSASAKRDLVFIGYITIIFALSTIYIGGLLQFTQQSFIDDRNIPDGPNTYELVMFSIPIDMLANVTMVMLSWFCDIVNVWRCTVIYQGSRVPVWAIVALPCLQYLGSIVFGMLWLKQDGTTGTSPWATAGINWTIPYYTMSLSLNILVTIMIVIRLLMCRAQINRALGETHGAQYTSLAAMIIESAALYSSFSLLFLVPFAIATPTANAISQIFIQSMSPVQCVSTLLIVFRVAQGKGWSHKTITTALVTTTVGGSSGTGSGSDKRRRGGTGMVFRRGKTSTMGTSTFETGSIPLGTPAKVNIDVNTIIDNGSSDAFASESKAEIINVV